MVTVYVIIPYRIICYPNMTIKHTGILPGKIVSFWVKIATPLSIQPEYTRLNSSVETIGGNKNGITNNQ